MRACAGFDDGPFHAPIVSRQATASADHFRSSTWMCCSTAGAKAFEDGRDGVDLGLRTAPLLRDSFLSQPVALLAAPEPAPGVPSSTESDGLQYQVCWPEGAEGNEADPPPT